MAEPHVRLETADFGVAEFSPDTRGMGRFQCGSFAIRMLPARLGDASEAGALVRRCRAHDIEGQSAWTVNTESRIPRDSEPWVVREWTLASNTLRVVSDLRVGGKMNFARIENDSLSIDCNWKKIELLPLQSNPDHPIGEWIVIKSGKEAQVYDNPLPPLVLRITSVDGETLEITEGEDLWRLLGGEGRFTLEAKSDGINITRLLGEWKESQTFSQRTWRRKWHIAYDAPKPPKPKKALKRDIILDINELEMAETASQSISGGWCMMSDPMMKGLRHAVRRLVATTSDSKVVLRGWSPGFCITASHCGRPNTRKMLHWDLTEMLEFWLWANRQLGRNGGRLSVEIPKESPFATLPSVRTLGFPDQLSEES